MTAAAAFTVDGKQQPVRASEQLRAEILTRIRQVAREQHVGFDGHGRTDFGLLASSDRLVKPLEAEVLRYALVAAIRRGLLEPAPGIRVAYARVLAMLSQYLWVGQHPYEPEVWPPRERIGEV